MMTPLNLPPAELRLTKKNGKVYVRCLIRSKEIVLTPEEWVRQHLVYYLTRIKGVQAGRLAIEMSITYNNMQRRCDLVVFDQKGIPAMIIECKAPDVVVNTEVFQQIAQYNRVLNVEYLLVSNGLDHIICRVDRSTGAIAFLNDLPSL